MSTDPTDREILDLLTGEDAQTPAAEWPRVLADVRASDGTSEPSPSFDRDLLARWKTELAAEQKPQVRRAGSPFRWPRLAMPLVAACVVIALVLFRPWGGPDDTGGPSGSSGVAWGDVVRAMQGVGHFHVIAFQDSPNSADVPPIIRLDLFHQQPDKWRAQGFGHVSFATTGGKQRIWNIEKGNWTGPKDRDPDILPADFIDRHEKLGTLGAVLAWFFDGNAPPGEPVKSDEVASVHGIDVFDYAKDASERWLRIWVLRESKLPLKMHVYQPASDDFLLVTFDYSDPQPAAFFDADAFARQAANVGGDGAFRERRVFSIGSRPVAGTRPRGADQVHEAVGGYRAPTVKRVLSNADGDVMVVTDRPENKTPEGYRPHFAGYRDVTDNWGNTFIYAGGGNSSGERRMYMALPPAKLTGPSPRRITMRFEVEDEYGTPPKVLKTETLDVPPPVAPEPGKKSEWPAEFAKEKVTWYRNHLRQNGTLAQQVAEVERALAADVNDVDALVWKYRLMREYGRSAAAVKFFESDLRDRLFNDPKLLGQYNADAASYLLALGGENRIDDLRKWSTHVNQVIEQLRGGNERSREDWRVEALLRTDYNPLYVASRLLEWRDAYKDGPKVLRTVASKDGLVYVELEIPAPPEGWRASGGSNGVPEGWFWRPWPTDRAWQVAGRVENLKERRLGLALRGGGGNVPLTLSAEVILQRDSQNVWIPQNDFKLPWRQTIEVPPPTADDMRAWLQQQGLAITWFELPATQPVMQSAPSPVQQWLDAADGHRKAGRFAEALELYGKVLAAPREQWPDMYTKAVALDPDLVEGKRRDVRVNRAECLAQLGRIDEARAEAAAIRAPLPPKPDLADALQGLTAADALAADVQVARGLLKRGDVKAAADELDRIATGRPNLQELPDGTVMVPRGEGTRFGWSPRHHQREAWRQFDAAWWEVRDALARDVQPN